MKTNERTLKMMDNFMDLHKQGLSVAEIAKRFDLSVTTVYARLSEIAKQNGVTRESLLERVFVADHSGGCNFTHVKPIDREDFEMHYQAATSEVDQLLEGVDNIIKDNEIMHEILEEEQK